MPPQAAALPNCGAVDAHGPRPTATAYVARRRRSESERAATTIGRRRKGSARAPDAPPRRLFVVQRPVGPVESSRPSPCGANDVRVGTGPAAVRDHHAVSLPVRPAVDRDGVLRRGVPDAALPHGPRGLRAAGGLLGQVHAHLVRRRRGDRDPPGVPVRHELVDLLALRRRRLRRAAGHGGARRLLRGVDLRRPVALRQGPAVARACTSRRSGASRSPRCCRPTSSSPPTRGCSTRSARASTPRGRARLTSIWDVLTNNTAIWSFAHVIFAALITGTVVRRVGGDLAPAPRPRGRRLHRGRARRAADPRRRRGLRAARRRPAGHAAHRAAADEDGGRRGAARHRAAGGVLDLRHGPAHLHAREQEPRAEDPAPALAAGHAQLERQGRSAPTRRRGPRRPATGPAATRRASRSSTGRSA